MILKLLFLGNKIYLAGAGAGVIGWLFVCLHKTTGFLLAAARTEGLAEDKTGAQRYG